MVSKTVVDSVTKVWEKPSNLALLEASLLELHARYPDSRFLRYLDRVPSVAPTAYVAPTAVLSGKVRLADEASVWPGCVLRADINDIEIGKRSNLQDGTVVHLGDHDGTFVAEEVVVGHRAVLHGCRIGAGCLIGIQATLLDGVVVGEGSVIGAGALVTAGTVIPARSLVLGAPSKVVKTLTAADENFHRALAAKYTRLAHNYRVG